MGFGLWRGPSGGRREAVREEVPRQTEAGSSGPSGRPTGDLVREHTFGNRAGTRDRFEMRKIESSAFGRRPWRRTESSLQGAETFQQDHWKIGRASCRERA